jgi:hypothetical protein
LSALEGIPGLSRIANSLDPVVLGGSRVEFLVQTVATFEELPQF